MLPPLNQVHIGVHPLCQDTSTLEQQVSVSLALILLSADPHVPHAFSPELHQLLLASALVCIKGEVSTAVQLSHTSDLASDCRPFTSHATAQSEAEEAAGLSQGLVPESSGSSLSDITSEAAASALFNTCQFLEPHACRAAVAVCIKLVSQLLADAKADVQAKPFGTPATPTGGKRIDVGKCAADESPFLSHAHHHMSN